MAEGEMNDHEPTDDPKAWLKRYSAAGWIERSLRELAVAETAFKDRQPTAAAAAMKRAAGMALNGALCVVPREEWGRSYVDHLKALLEDPAVPKAVSEAARIILEFTPQPGTLVFLRSPGKDSQLLEATRTVMAHAYAVVNGNVGRV